MRYAAIRYAATVAVFSLLASTVAGTAAAMPSRPQTAAAFDPSRVAALLEADRPVVLDLAPGVELTGDWTLPPGRLVIRAGGELTVRDLRLTAPGLHLTLSGPAVRLLGSSRLNLSDLSGRGGEIVLEAHAAGAGVVEIGPEAVIDASGDRGLGGAIRLAGDAVRSAGSLFARGQGRISVEALHAFAFTGPADTAGGLIRLDPSNMVIAATDANVTNGASGSAITRSPAADTGELSAATLAGLLATNDVIVHTLSSGSATGILLPAGFPTMDATGGDIDVQANVVWASTHFLWLLAHDDLIVRASVQNAGGATGGSVVGIAGWDGSSMSGLDTDALDPATSTVYGAGSGDVFVLGPELSNAPGIAFGSRIGTTALAGRNVSVLGSNAPVNVNNAFAMVGFRVSAAGLDTSGDLRVRAKGAVRVLGGTDTGTFRGAQIGHGGCLNNGTGANALGSTQDNLFGNISVTAAGAIQVMSGTRQSWAQIGNGGCVALGSTRGNVGGNIDVKGDTVSIQQQNASVSNLQTYAMIGNGGAQYLGHNVTGTVGGDIRVETTGGDLVLLPLNPTGSTDARIGNGGTLNTTADTGNTAFVRSSFGALSGNITVVVARDLLQQGGTASQSYSQIGHGGYILSAGLMGPASGSIDVTVGRDAILRSTSSTVGNPRPAQIGHGGGTRAIFVPVAVPVGSIPSSERQALSGPIHVTVGRELRLLPGITQVSYVQIGHGSLLWTEQQNTKAVLASASGDITVQASTLELRGGTGSAANGGVSYAQVGNGGPSLMLNINTETHHGPDSGAIQVTTTGASCLAGPPTPPFAALPCGDLVLVGGTAATGGSYAWIGHGGEPYDTGVGNLGTQVSASGDITVTVAKETTLVNGPTDFWHIGHLLLAPTPITSSNVRLDTATLDFTEASTSASGTINDPRFWPQYVHEAPALPAIDYADNVAGGSVTLRLRGSAGNNGNLDTQQSLTVPAGAANPVTLISTDDLTIGAAITNNGTSLVDLVADDANPTSPASSPTALFSIGAGGSIAGTGSVRLFAVAPAQFTAGSYVPPATAFSIWYGDPGAVVGVNFKSTPPSADLSITKVGTPDPVDAGNNLVYTITVTNGGPGTAAAASLTDTLPAGTTFVSLSSPGGWSCGGLSVGSGGTLTCTHSALPIGSSVFTLTVKVDATTAVGTVLSNTAAVSSSTPDPNPGSESATATTTVSRSSDLSIAKVGTPDPVTAGSNLTYTITATNLGPSEAAAATVADTLPAGTTFVSLASPGGWSCTTPAVGAGGSISCTASPLAPGNAVFTLVVKVAPSVANGTLLSNTATISSPVVDPVPGNGSDTATTTVATSADVGVTKVGTPDPVAVGGLLSYTITVGNAGPSDAATVTLDDTLPAGTTFVSLAWPGGWSCSAPAVGTGGAIACSAASLAPGSAVFTLVVKVDATLANGTVLSNTATAGSATTDPVPGNASATATTTVRALEYFTVTPCRLVDTRSPAAPNGGPALVASQTRTFVLAGSCGIPATARAVQLNVTVVGPTAGGFLHVFGGTLGTPPPTVVVAFRVNRTIAGNSVVELGAAGDVKVFNESPGQAHVLLDVSGYFE